LENCHRNPETSEVRPSDLQNLALAAQFSQLSLYQVRTAWTPGVLYKEKFNKIQLFD